MPSAFPCGPMICECSWTKTKDRKKPWNGLEATYQIENSLFCTIISK